MTLHLSSRPEPATGATLSIASVALLPHLRQAAVVAFALLSILVIWLVPTGLSNEARLAVAILTLAIIGWTLTRLDDTAVAIIACIALIATGVVREKQLYNTLGSELIWLLVGAFILAAVLKASGLTELIAFALVRRLRSVRGLFHGVTTLLVATALLVPSTSGRAALALPIFLALAERLDERALVRALALLFPTVILLSAGGSLIGAGAHFVAVDYIRLLGGRTLGFLDWLVIGMPLALVLCYAATELILRLFLDAEARQQSPDFGSLPTRTFSFREGGLTALLCGTVLLWLTAGWHGYGIAMVTLVAALLATWPGVSPITLKQAVKSVEWDLLLFLAATMLLGEALLATNAEEWAARRLVMFIGGAGAVSAGFVVLIVIAVSLLAHLVITSRTARATVLIPMLVIPMMGLGVDPTALILVAVMGTGFCQTLPASAKPVALYSGLAIKTYSGTDLLQLSLALVPVMALTLAVCAFVYWPMLGISPWR